jgi:hypothetical protein
MSDQVRRIVTQPAPVGDEVISLYQSTPATRVAAFAYKQPVATTAPKPEQEGYEWGAIDVRTCALVDEIVVSTRPWMVAYADSTMARASSTGYQQFPEPLYPWGEQPVPKDRCVRGWITVPVPAGKRPVTIQYNPGVGGGLVERLL